MNNQEFVKLIKPDIAHLAPGTQDCYLDELRRFTEFTNDRPLIEATPQDAAQYRAHLDSMLSPWDKKPLATSTKKRKIESLYTIFESAVGLELVQKNPFLRAATNIRKMNVEQKRPNKLVAFEGVKPAINLHEHDQKSLTARDRALFSVLFGGGLRVSEVCRLKYQDLIRINGLIGLKTKTSKTNDHRPVLLPAWASFNIEQYLKDFNEISGDLFLFPSRIGNGTRPITRKWVSELCFKAFGARAHSARVTNISFLLYLGVPLPDIARAVGHRSISSTLIYDKRLLEFKTCVSTCVDYESPAVDTMWTLKKAS